MKPNQRIAPGWPGIEPRWTSSDKSGVGTATTSASRVWFTLSHGILNEIYYPEIDQAAIRDMGFLVTGPDQFLAEEKRDTQHQIRMLAPGVPAFELVNECNQNRFRLTKTVITDPVRDVVLQKIRFEALKGALGDYRLYILLAPHLGNAGYGNNGWAGEYKGVRMLFAERNASALALACSVGFEAMSCGYVGVSDGWQDLHQHHRMEWQYERADNGNIALMAEINPANDSGELVLACGFGQDVQKAGQNARASLQVDFQDQADAYLDGWNAFHSRCKFLPCPKRNGFDLYRISTSVLKVHESKQFAGAMIASLSIPWGSAKSDQDLGGYHLVWPRDLVETAGGLLASGDTVSALRTLIYLMSTQESDGHWPQNMWLSGDPYWQGIQTDETAFFILLADALRRADVLGKINPYPAIKNACRFLLQKGPVTEQDRWEENSGYSPFTLAVEISAMLAAAEFADENHDQAVAGYLRETADSWNALIESLTYVQGTELARQAGVEGYYVRIAPPEVLPGDDVAASTTRIRNLPDGETVKKTADIVSPDALALVRFGLRSATDPRILNTLKVIDATLKTATATGPGWYRYNHDGYGEKADGGAYDGTGIGRVWPLLAGERAHYELAAGNRAEAEHLLEVMIAQSSDGGLLPEQVWDRADLPQAELFNGHPSGSAMPLVWAHSECIKLVRSLADGEVFDLPPQTVRRYLGESSPAQLVFWKFDFQRRSVPAGLRARLELMSPATVLWTTDDWNTTDEIQSMDSGLGIHYADLDTAELDSGTRVQFTFFWLESQSREGRNFSFRIE